MTAALLAKSLARTVPQAAASEHQCTLSRLQRPPVTPARVTAGICAMAAAKSTITPARVTSPIRSIAHCFDQLTCISTQRAAARSTAYHLLWLHAQHKCHCSLPMRASHQRGRQKAACVRGDTLDCTSFAVAAHTTPALLPFVICHHINAAARSGACAQRHARLRAVCCGYVDGEEP